MQSGKSGALVCSSLGILLKPMAAFAQDATVEDKSGAITDIVVTARRATENAQSVPVFRSYVRDLQQTVSGVSTGNFAGAGLACTGPGSPPFIDGDCDPSNDPQGTVLTINAGKLRTTGVELESVIAPSRNLTVTMGATFIDAKVTAFSVPAILAAVAPANLGTLYTPKRTFSGDVRYVLPLDDRIGEVALNATYYTSSKFELVGYTAKGYQLVNARLDWNNILGSQVSGGIFARNLFNAKYVSGPAITAVGLPLTSVIVGDPRAYGVVLRVAFGAR